MGKFKAIVYRTRRIEQEAEMEIEADSLAAASDAAYEVNVPETAWTTVDASTEDYALGDVTRIKGPA